jgi:hypothetical protein
MAERIKRIVETTELFFINNKYIPPKVKAVNKDSV